MPCSKVEISKNKHISGHIYTVFHEGEIFLIIKPTNSGGGVGYIVTIVK